MARRVSLPNQKLKKYTYEELYSEYWEQLFKQFYSLEKDFHIAEDLAQETMMRIWIYFDRVQMDKVSGIVGTIANNTRFDYMRKYLNRVDTQSYDETEGILEFACHDEGLTDPLRALLQNEAGFHIDKILITFTDFEKDIFADMYLRNMKIDSITDKYKMTRTNVYVKLFRIRNKFVEMLKPFGIDYNFRGNHDYY